METLKLIKLSEDSPKKEGYYFVILHNSLKDCLWWSEKDGFISRNADKHRVYGWYSDEAEPDFGALERAFEAGRDKVGITDENDDDTIDYVPKFGNFAQYKAHLLTLNKLK